MKKLALFLWLMLFPLTVLAAGDGVTQALWVKAVADIAPLYTSGGLDNETIEDGDLIICSDGTNVRFYTFDLDSGQTEDGNIYITPDEISDGNAYSGNGRWKLTGFYMLNSTQPKVSGQAGDSGWYEANSTDTDTAGFSGPASLTANTSYRGQFPNARATSGNMVLAWTNSGETGTGTPADPYVQAMSFVDLDNYALLNSPSFTTPDIGAATGTSLVLTGKLTCDSLELSGTGDSYAEFENNTTITGSGYQIFFEGGQFVVVENGTEYTVIDSGSSWSGGDLTGTGLAATISTGAVGADELASTAVIPGSYTNTNLTVDADGRITAASNGSGGSLSITGAVDGGIGVTTASGTALINEAAFTYNTSTNVLSVENISYTGYIASGADPADQGVIRLPNAAIIAWEDATELTLTHVDNTGLTLNGVMEAASFTTTRTTDPQYMRLYEGNGEAGDNYFQITATAMAANVTLTALDALPASSSFLTISDAGVMSSTATNTIPTLAGTNSFTGANTIGDGGDLIAFHFDSTPASDATGGGEYITVQTSAGVTVAAGDVLVVVTSASDVPVVALADADVSGKVGMILLGTEAISPASTGKAMLRGVFRLDSWDWAASNTALFVSGTAGDLATSAGSYGQKCGYALTDDSIYWNPSLEIAH